MYGKQEGHYVHASKLSVYLSATCVLSDFPTTLLRWNYYLGNLKLLWENSGHFVFIKGTLGMLISLLKLITVVHSLAL